MYPEFWLNKKLANEGYPIVVLIPLLMQLLFPLFSPLQSTRETFLRGVFNTFFIVRSNEKYPFILGEKPLAKCKEKSQSCYRILWGYSISPPIE